MQSTAQNKQTSTARRKPKHRTWTSPNVSKQHAKSVALANPKPPRHGDLISTPSKVGKSVAINLEASPALRSKSSSPKSSTARPTVRSGAGAADLPKGDSITHRETAVAPRTRNQRGIPVIPGLADPGMIVFYEIWKQTQELTMDDAVGRLDGVLELIQHHPALAPEVDALRALDKNWSALQPVADTCRLAMFELGLDLARGQVPAKALVTLQALRAMHGQRADLAKEMEQVGAVLNAWTALSGSAVFERCENL